MSVTGPCERSARRGPLDEITTLRLGTTVRLGLCTCTSQFTSSYNVLRVEEKFNPSPTVVKMRKLYDGKRQRVGGSENAFLAWTDDDQFDEKAAGAVHKSSLESERSVREWM